MAFVIDASIVGTWMFTDESHDRADLALDRLAHEEALAPTHWWFEVRNMLVIGERRRRTSQIAGAEFLAWLNRLPIRLAPLPEEHDALALARRHQLTFYDACYCELARRAGLPLAALDERLTRAARQEGVLVLGE